MSPHADYGHEHSNVVMTSSRLLQMTSSTSAVAAGEEDVVVIQADGDTFIGHLIAGTFLLTFGGFFLLLTILRMNRIIAAMAASSSYSQVCTEGEDDELCRLGDGFEITDVDDDEAKEEKEISDSPAPAHGSPAARRSLNDPSDQIAICARIYCQQHIPEHNPELISRTSLALVLSTTFGLVLESVGGMLIRYEDHPDYNLFSYALHETVTVLFLVVGLTGWLEAGGYLPRDSIRMALVVAFGGEGILWHVHASTKIDFTTAWIHNMLSMLATCTALTLLLSVLLVGNSNSHHDASTTTSSRGRDSTLSATGRNADNNKAGIVDRFPLTVFLLHVSTFVLIIWQGVWFITAGRHSTTPLQRDRVPCYFVLQGLACFVAMQAYFVFMAVRLRRAR